jgi:hypothetical protein
LITADALTVCPLQFLDDAILQVDHRQCRSGLQPLSARSQSAVLLALANRLSSRSADAPIAAFDVAVRDWRLDDMIRAQQCVGLLAARKEQWAKNRE